MSRLTDYEKLEREIAVLDEMIVEAERAGRHEEAMELSEKVNELESLMC